MVTLGSALRCTRGCWREIRELFKKDFSLPLVNHLGVNPFRFFECLGQPVNHFPKYPGWLDVDADDLALVISAVVGAIITS